MSRPAPAFGAPARRRRRARAGPRAVVSRLGKMLFVWRRSCSPTCARLCRPRRGRHAHSHDWSRSRPGARGRTPPGSRNRARVASEYRVLRARAAPSSIAGRTTARGSRSASRISQCCFSASARLRRPRRAHSHHSSRAALAFAWARAPAGARSRAGRVRLPRCAPAQRGRLSRAGPRGAARRVARLPQVLAAGRPMAESPEPLSCGGARAGEIQEPRRRVRIPRSGCMRNVCDLRHCRATASRRARGFAGLAAPVAPARAADQIPL